MAFQLEDPFENHAFFSMSFDCDNCGDYLEPDSRHVAPSDEWCRDYAQQARVEGWFVPPPKPDGSMNVETCLCPRCKEALAVG